MACTTQTSTACGTVAFCLTIIILHRGHGAQERVLMWSQKNHKWKVLSKKNPLMSKKTIAIFGYKQRLLSIEMKTKLVQHVESDWMRDWKNVKVRLRESERESESVRLTFEHRDENKSCSACQEWFNERLSVRVRKSVTVRKWERVRVRMRVSNIGKR